MQQCRDSTVGEALAEFRSTHRLAADYVVAPFWTCRIGPVTLTLPNFEWRRAAIARHDLHHVLTGYPCSMRGEFQMAAWEFAAGRFPHPAATLFCLPLVAAGVCWSPRAIWRAFLAGRRSQSLYASATSDEFFQTPLNAARAGLRNEEPPRSRAADALAFGYLVLQSGLTIMLPIAGVMMLGLFLFKH